jgi:hypothetical protein
MVTDLPERGVLPLLRVAVKVAERPTAGVVVDAERAAVVVGFLTVSVSALE